MFNFLKNLFSSKPAYGLGAFDSPVDTRDIDLAGIQVPVVLPDEYKTDMPPEKNQGIKSKCVGSGMTLIEELFLSKKAGEWILLSDDDLYEQCKLMDGIPDVAGTYPAIGAKIVTKSGVATVEAYNSKDFNKIMKSRAQNKLEGYAFVAPDFLAICQAIYQNLAVTAVFSVSSDWYRGKITKVLTSIGKHCTVLHGFKLSNESLKGQNSWGVGWIGYIAGIFNKDVKPGHFELAWADYKDNITDIIAFTRIPAYILEEVKSRPYTFTQDLKIGMTGYEVLKLQEYLSVALATGYFGPLTQKFVMRFQQSKGLKGDGIIGAKTREKLNMKKSYIDDWCEAIKQMEGAKAYRNNPGNLRFVGQQYAVNDKGFCKFDTYEHGYNALKNLLLRACTGKSSNYVPDMTLYEFYAGVSDEKKYGRKISGYAPDSDGNNSRRYSQFVADELGVPVETKIKNLI